MNFALDSNHDLYLNGTTLAMVTDANDELVQQLKTRLLTFQGEWFLDPSLGVPYFQTVYGKSKDLDAIRAAFITAIYSVPGVTNITELTLTFNQTERKLAVDFKVTNTAGDTVSGGINV